MQWWLRGECRASRHRDRQSWGKIWTLWYTLRTDSYICVCAPVMCAHCNLFGLGNSIQNGRIRSWLHSSQNLAILVIAFGLCSGEQLHIYIRHSVPSVRATELCQYKRTMTRIWCYLVDCGEGLLIMNVWSAGTIQIQSALSIRCR